MYNAISNAYFFENVWKQKEKKTTNKDSWLDLSFSLLYKP